MNRTSERHRAAYHRLVLPLMPRDHRLRHGDEQAQLFADLVESGESPLRLWGAAVADVVALNFDRARDNANLRRTVMSNTARLALWPLSVAVASVGLVVGALALASSAVPAWVALPATGMVLQGGFTVGWAVRSGGDHDEQTAGHAVRPLFVGGETVALLLGTLGIVVALAGTVPGSDADYGPLTMLTLVTVHGLVGLMAALLDDRPAGT